MNLIPYVKSGYPVLYVVTAEENRAELQVLKTAQELKRKVKVWSHTEGFATPDGKEVEQIEDPVAALERTKGEPTGTIIVMRDLHMFLTVPKTIRLVRDIARDFKQQKKTLVIVSPVKKLPAELERDVTVLEFDLPKREEIEMTLKTLYETSGAKKKLGEMTADEHERTIQSAMGLTLIEAENAFSKAIIEFAGSASKDAKTGDTVYGEPISRLVMKEKANTVKKTGILEYFEAKTGADDIGGLENLKEWLTTRSKAFSKQARDFGLPMPRGILLVGLPGCGKSLSAKAASNILGVPLLRFDIGKVFGGLVGESLAPDEEIIFHTPSGAKRFSMEDAYNNRGELIGSKVSSFTPSMNHQLKTVDGVIRHKRSTKLLKITTTSGKTVKATEEHSLFTIGDNGCLEEICAEKLLPGTPLAVSNGEVEVDSIRHFNLLSMINKHGDQKKWYVANSYTIYGDSLREIMSHKSFHSFKRYDANIKLSRVKSIPAGAKLTKHHSKQEFDQDFELTPEIMELLGWFVAEGSFSGDTNTPRLSINSNEVECVTNLISRCNLSFTTHKESNANAFSVFFGGCGFGDILKYLDVKSERIPEWIYGTSKALRRAFIRGFFSGDGGVSGHNIEASQANSKIIGDIMMLLSSVGIHGRCYNVKPHAKLNSNPNTKRLSISTASMIKKFRDEIGFTQPEKNTSAKNISGTDNGQWIPNFELLSSKKRDMRKVAYRSGTTEVNFNGAWVNLKTASKIMPEIQDWDVVFEKIKSVEVIEDQPEYVYDISVKDNHNFVSGFGGIICHNSERNMRTAIQTAEAVGNCVLWIDEMEKAFAGMGSGGTTDGGTSQRVFGNFITWMQEKTTPCFIISTVNRIESLPPELLRKGRFDETFFVGLPSDKERDKILRIHINKYGKKLSAFSDKDLEDCVKQSHGFSGAEIEEAVVTGLYAAFNHSRELKAEDVIKALKETNPLSKSKAQELENMGRWAESNAINASRLDKKDKVLVANAGRQLDI